MSYIRILKNDLYTIANSFLQISEDGKANCPFHNDTNPSLFIDKEKQLFHCFGCGVGGDVITFKQLIQEKIDQFSKPIIIKYTTTKGFYGKVKTHKSSTFCLTPREREVLALRMGLYDKRRHFLREIGEILGVSTERARQIEQKAMRRFIWIIRYQRRKK